MKKEKECHEACISNSLEIARGAPMCRGIVALHALGLASGLSGSVEAAGEWIPTHVEPVSQSMSELIKDGAQIVDTISGLSGIGFLLKTTNDESATHILCEFRRRGGSKPSAETRCFALNK